MTTSTRPRILLLGLAAAAALCPLAGCGSHPADVASAPDPAVGALQSRAALASRLSFTGTYAVSDSADTAAVVRVWVTPQAYRVEVSERTVTAALYGTAKGTVACPEQTGKPTVCFTVAAVGKPVPTVFDAGIERVFTRDLPALAAGAAAFQVVAEQPSAAVTKIAPGATCYRVSRLPGAPAITDALVQLVDEGTYCLGTDGTPAQLGFASGTLTLTRHGGAPTAKDLALPAVPQPLPASVLSASPSASAKASLPQVFGGSVSPGPSASK